MIEGATITRRGNTRGEVEAGIMREVESTAHRKVPDVTMTYKCARTHAQTCPARTRTISNMIIE